jgi:ketosteroid isomerase-like protein
MPDGSTAIQKVLQNYKAAVLAKDVNAYIALYDDNVRIFDMGQEWSNRGAPEWRISAEDWFNSLGAERVLVEDDSVIIHVADTLATLDGFIARAIGRSSWIRSV